MRAIQMTRTMNHLPGRRGIALLLVMAVIGLAAVLGYAMLSAAALQRQLQTSVTRASQAEYLAESGIGLAAYFLKNPTKAPGYIPGGDWYWRGTNGQQVGFAQGTSGTVNVSVVRDNTLAEMYTVSSTGRAAGPDGAIARSVHARLSVVTKSNGRYAGLFDKDVILPELTLIGEATSDTERLVHVLSRRSVKVLVGAYLHGNAYRGVLVYSPSSPIPPGRWKSLPNPTPVIPLTLAELRDYSKYMRHGMEMQQAATSTSTTIAAGTRLEPTEGNSGGIYIYEGDLTLKEGVEIRGTLIVKGNLIIQGANIRIIAQDGLPALLVGGNVDMSALLPFPELNIEGVMWVGGRIFGSLATSPKLLIRGNLVVAGFRPLFYETPLAVTNIQDPSLVGNKIVGLTATNTVKVVEWW